MGLSIKTRARHQQTESDGNLHLDSRTLSFSGKDLQWTVGLGPAIRATAADGWLVVQQGGDRAEFEVGDAAEKWIEKILHPPTRLQKLGLARAMKYWTAGRFDAAFVQELNAIGAVRVKKLCDGKIALLRVGSRDELGKLVDVANELVAGVNVWVVWPKGSSDIAQRDVMELAASCGLGPSKTAAFDDQHSSMRFAKKKLP